MALNTARRFLIGILFGGLAGAVVGPIAGAIAGVVHGGSTIFLMGPLYVPSTAYVLLLAGLMLLCGPSLGAVVGFITVAVNRPHIGWLVGLLLGIVAGVVLFAEALMAAIGAVIGLTAAVVVQTRLFAEPTTSLSTQGLRKMLQTSADSYGRTRLGLWIGFCLPLVLLSAFQLTSGDPILWPIWVVVMLLFAVAGIYFGYLLTLEKN